MVKEKATLGGVAVLIAGSSRSVWWQNPPKDGAEAVWGAVWRELGDCGC